MVDRPDISLKTGTTVSDLEQIGRLLERAAKQTKDFQKAARGGIELNLKNDIVDLQSTLKEMKKFRKEFQELRQAFNMSLMGGPGGQLARDFEQQQKAFLRTFEGRIRQANSRVQAAANPVSRAQAELDRARIRSERMLAESAGRVTDQYRGQLRIVSELEKKYDEIKRDRRETLSTEREITRNHQQSRNMDLVRSRSRVSTATSMDRVLGSGSGDTFRTQTALTANFFAVTEMMNALRFATQFVVQFDEALFNLQAITASSDATMQSFRATIEGVANTTKFTAVEVADAARVLGQAGFSVREVQQSLQAVADFAAATGTQMADAVDVMTSAISVFNRSASEAADVANTFTAAINRSKLTQDKLTLGLQYSSNVAAQAGVGFTDLTASLAGLANAGIRSGSTIGTNLRAFLIELQSPSEALKEALTDVGLTLRDIDLEANGIIGVIENMSEAGFSSAEAFASLERRAANAFLALKGQVGSLREVQTELSGTSAAADASETQMRALANTARNTTSVVGGTLLTAFEPLIEILQSSLEAFNGFLDRAQDFTGLMKAFGGAVTGLAVGAIAQFLIRITRAGVGTQMFADHLQRTGRAFTVFARRGRIAAAVMSLFSMNMTAVIGVGASLAFWITDMVDRTDELKEALDEANGAFEETEGALEDKQTTLRAVNEEIASLVMQQRSLRDSDEALEARIRELNDRFGELGLTIDATSSSYDDLMESMGGVRSLAVEQAAALAEMNSQAAQNQVRAQAALLRDTTGRDLTGMDQGWGVNGRGSDMSEAFRALGVLPRRLSTRRPDGTYATAITSPDQLATVFERIGLGDASNVIRTAQSGRLDTLSSNDAQRAFNSLSAFVNQSDDEVVHQAFQPVLDGFMDTFQEIRRLEQNRRQAEDAVSESAQMSALTEGRGRYFNSRVRLARESLADLLEEVEGSFETQDDPRLRESALQNRAQDLLANLDYLRGDIAAIEDDNLRAALQDEVIAVSEMEADLRRRLREYGELALETQQAITENNFDAAQEVLREANQRVRQADSFPQLQAASENLDEALDGFVEQRLRQLMNELELSPYFQDQVISGIDRSAITTSGVIGAIERNSPESINLSERAQIDGAVRAILGELSNAQQVTTTRGRTITENNRQARVETLAQQIDGVEADLEELLRPIEGEQLLVARERVDEALQTYQRLLALRNEKLQAELRNPELTDQDRVARQEEFEREARRTRRRFDRDSVGTLQPAIERRIRLIDAQRKFNDQERFGDGRQAFEIRMNRSAEMMEEIFALQRELLQIELERSEAGEPERAARLNELQTQQSRERALFNRGIRNERRGLPTVSAETLGQDLKNQLQFTELEREIYSLSNTIADSITSAADQGGKAMGQMFRDLATGAENVEDAFAKMAVSVLDAMLQVVTNALAQQFVQMLVNVGLTAFGGSASAGANGFAGGTLGSSVGLNAYHGRIIRAQQGSIIRAASGVTSRDHQLVYAQDGEAILRKSAVSALGEDTVNRLNAMGNRVASERAPDRPLMAPQSEPETTNIYVMLPEEKPSLSKNDVLITVTDDMRRGGMTKKLVQTITKGGGV